MWGGALNYRPLLFCETVLQLAVTEEISSAYLGNKGCLVRFGGKTWAQTTTNGLLLANNNNSSVRHIFWWINGRCLCPARPTFACWTFFVIVWPLKKILLQYGQIDTQKSGWQIQWMEVRSPISSVIWISNEKSSCYQCGLDFPFHSISLAGDPRKR